MPRARSSRLASMIPSPGLLVAALFAMGGVAGVACGSTGQGKAKPREGKDGTDPPKVPAAQARVELDLFVFGRVRGTIAPCGCTTEPLGGLQYVFGYIEANSTPGARLVIEPGSFLYPEPDSPEWPVDEQGWTQAEQRAEALQARFNALGDDLVSGVGPIDVRSPTGTAALGSHALPRVLTNLDAPAPGLPSLPTHELVTLDPGGTKLVAGVTAVVDPSQPEAGTLGTLGDPIAALRTRVAAMRKEGAGLTVALAHGDRSFAERIAREVDDLDIVVVGWISSDMLERQKLGEPAGQLSGTYIVEPGEQLQSITHLHLSVAPGQPVVPRSEAWVVPPPRDQQKAQLERVQARLDKFKADPSADAAFIARLEAERDQLAASLEGGEPQGPVVAVFDQVKVTCKLPADADAGTTLSAYTAWVSEQNEAFYKGKKAPPPPAGSPGYAGLDECETCHEEAVEFWRTTVHAGAYQTLVDTNQQYDLACISCHVTGFREPGGSEVVENQGLRDVQCEVCHGPGTFHVDEPEASKGGAQHIRLDSPQEVCGKCHTPEHSDTFDYAAYMRDVLGPGHGDKARQALGDGPTGAELRAAGLAAAGGKCKTM